MHAARLRLGQHSRCDVRVCMVRCAPRAMPSEPHDPSPPPPHIHTPVRPRRQILGPRLHITGAVGEAPLREWASEVGDTDVSWAGLGPQPTPTPTASTRGAPPPSSPASGAATAAVPTSPPAGATRSGTSSAAAYQPGVLQAHSQHLTGEMRVWVAKGHTLLQEPARATLEFTPALAR